ncbi:helix-turn-helix domain-containing protein, partial [Klebsiella pneumoniae]
MTRVSISEAARLTGKSRTTLHRLIKTGELSTCSGERNTKMVDISELLRVFGPF